MMANHVTAEGVPYSVMALLQFNDRRTVCLTITAAIKTLIHNGTIYTVSSSN